MLTLRQFDKYNIFAQTYQYFVSKTNVIFQ